MEKPGGTVENEADKAHRLRSKFGKEMERLDMEGEDSPGSKLMGQGMLAKPKFRRFWDKGQMENRDQGC